MRYLPLMTLLVLFALPPRAHAQAPADTTSASMMIEAALEAAGEAENPPAELVEWLTELEQHPLDVNRSTVDELARLPGLSAVLARRIVRRRDAQGPYTSLPELRVVRGMDAATYRAVRPFLTIGPERDAAGRSGSRLAALAESLEGRVIQRFTRRLDVGPGYTPDTARTTYAGSPARLYTRLQLTAQRRLSLNLTVEKDPGEAFQWNPRAQTYGFDHVTGHAALRDVGWLETLVVGDFSAAFGQGVALWRSFAFSKGRDAVGSVARRGRGLAPYGSTDENRFFRGVGATVRLASPVTVSAFGSRRTLDATRTADSTGAPSVTTLATSGLHRTPHELQQKDAAREHFGGGALEVRSARGQLGLVGYRSVLSPPLASSPARARLFEATGRTFSVASAYANLLVGAASLFGEVAHSAPSSWGGLGGAQIDLTHAEAVLAVRHYPRDFTSRYGNAFGEQGHPPRNETGMYLGLSVQPARHWRLSGYFDQYRFPWLRYQTPRPTVGHDARLVVEHDPRPWLHHYLQLRTATREESVPYPAASGALLDGVHPSTRRSARWHGTYAFSAQLRLRTRLEASHTTDAEGTYTGLLIYQGLRWRPRPWLRLDGRWTLFDTDGYPARLYAYEHDLLYAFSVPVFSGRGERQYLLLNVTPRARLNLEAKYSVTRYRDVTSVGSGLDEVAGPRVREVRAQVRWRF